MNVKQNGKGVGKVRGGGAGAFDKLQKSRPVINQAGICPGTQDPEHLLGLQGSRAGKEGSPSLAWGQAGDRGLGSSATKGCRAQQCSNACRGD